MRAIVFATRPYEKEARRLLTREERAAVEQSIAADPGLHPVVAGTGGARKARWGRQGSGKSGGVRVIYYFLLSTEVYLLFLYAKNEQADLTPADKRSVKKLIEEIKRERQKE